jgi:argininosuccinate lyase
MEEINASIDVRPQALRGRTSDGSKAHVGACWRREKDIVTRDDATRSFTGLDTIRSEIESGAFTFQRSLEDIHMNIEARLAELIGPPAGRLHTARSRNDQVATDFRLWVRDTLDTLDAAAGALIQALPKRRWNMPAT